jgi:hypothetical protein
MRVTAPFAVDDRWRAWRGPAGISAALPVAR